MIKKLLYTFKYTGSVQKTSIVRQESIRKSIEVKNTINGLVLMFLNFPNSYRTRNLTHEKIFCTDEAYFYLTEASNKHNNRFWLRRQPLDLIEKLLALFLIFAVKIYRPFIFQISKLYLEMLKSLFWSKHLKLIIENIAFNRIVRLLI